MNKYAALLVLIVLLVGCGATPEATSVPPTQTPWIIVVTATADPDSVAQVGPTQTPWIIVATPTRTRQVTPTPLVQATAAVQPTREPGATETEPAPTPVPPTPTASPEPGSLKYPAPELLDPPSGILVAWKGTINLVWEGVGDLAEDEYYHVHLERPPVTDATPWYGDYVFTRDTSFFADQSFLAPFHLAREHGRAEVFWWVRVVRKTGEDENGKPLGVDVGQPSERWTFTVEPSSGG